MSFTNIGGASCPLGTDACLQQIPSFEGMFFEFPSITTNYLPYGVASAGRISEAFFFLIVITAFSSAQKSSSVKKGI